MQPKSRKKLNLALQGGGAHGAFTWGVLDRLLDEDKIEIEAISGTSAGAMNAALMIYGLAIGDKATARQCMEDFWRKISIAASLSPLQPTPLDKIMGNNDLSFSPPFMAMDYMMRMFSPYQLNFFDLNPLKEVLTEVIDFEKLRDKKPIKLFVNATNVLTGKIKIFECHEMHSDVLLASACLPYLYKAVEINGEYYWDGGYSGNPALFPLIYNTQCQDVLIVEINPINIDTLPVSAHEIMDRVNEISFNSTLMREIRAISFVSKLIAEGKASMEGYKDMRVHMISGGDVVRGLGYNSKMNADWSFLTHLRDAGRQAADEWLGANFDKIGKETSVNLKEYFL